LLQGDYQADVYTGAIDEEHAHLLDVHRLTMDERNDFPTAWTPDGGAIIHHSERNGHYAILKQSLSGPSTTGLVAGAGDYRAARVTPDGQYLLYEARPIDWLRSRTGPCKLMRVPLEGGSSEQVLTRYVPFSVRCAQLPARPCVMMERELRQLVFSRLDPVLGVQEVLAREPAALGLQVYNWDLSPDGSMIALALNNASGSVVRTIDLGKKIVQDAALTGSPIIQSLDWSPDSTGWYISSPAADGAVLTFVRRTGEVIKLRNQPGSLTSWAVPSHDGKRLAILEWTVTSNAWMIDNF
jgi:Tol biopolymer transport system component